MNGEGVSYTVPQRVRLSGVEKAVEVFFRVRRVYEGDLKIVAESGGEALAAYKRENLAPARWSTSPCPRCFATGQRPGDHSIQEAAK